MRFVTLKRDGAEQAAIQVDASRWVPLDIVDVRLRGDLLVLIQQEWPLDRLHEMEAEASKVPDADCVAVEKAEYGPPYRKPPKIFGIGLNYLEHATDLGENRPDEPASFIKGHHTIIGPEDPIQLPLGSDRVTAEAELALIMGKEAYHVSEDAALSAVFGFCAVLDQTAEDILAKNPRYLTRSKNYPSFFSLGPEVVTVDEFLSKRRLDDVVVTTGVGEEARTNTVSHMAHSPQSLVSFHSEVMPWYPGDILSTGTPGAIPIEGGDVARCEVDGLLPLENPVLARPDGN